MKKEREREREADQITDTNESADVEGLCTRLNSVGRLSKSRAVRASGTSFGDSVGF